MGRKQYPLDKKYHRLTPIEYYSSEQRWLCKCDCGGFSYVKSYALRIGRVKSCGCLKREVDKSRNIIHGGSGTSFYARWQNMINRCHNPNRKDFKYYGARGIVVCKRWRLSFKNFIKDMGYPPFEGATIDRINVDGNYEPNNCRWATMKEQSKNKRSFT